MLTVFENMARMHPRMGCCVVVDKNGTEHKYTYSEVRMMSAALAQYLRAKGVGTGDAVLVNLPSSSLWVFLVLAAAYGNFALAALDHELSDTEKIAQGMELGRQNKAHVAFMVNEKNADELLYRAERIAAGQEPADAREARNWGAGARQGRGAQSQYQPSPAATHQRRNSQPFGTARSGPSKGAEARSLYPDDLKESLIHYAEWAARVFEPESLALYAFTSGISGKRQVVPLEWEKLIGAAEASNARLTQKGDGLCQICRPLYCMDGLHAFIECICNANPCIVYECFDARRVVRDAVRYKVTHAVVDGAMLQGMLGLAEGGSRYSQAAKDALAQYQGVVVPCTALTERLLKRVETQDAVVIATYGMTETAGPVGMSLASGLPPYPLELNGGYEARIVEPNALGYGRLALKGPGVLRDYLNERAPHTVDGFFVTGDVAAFRNGSLLVKSRTESTLISGGENIYPDEIVYLLRSVPGVSDAYLLGVQDESLGRRPVAFVERDANYNVEPRASQLKVLTNQDFSNYVFTSLAGRLPKALQQQCIFALRGLPRTEEGKVDRGTLELMYEQRIEVKRARLFYVRIPFKEPYCMAKNVLRNRDCMLVEFTDHAGRIGLGECLSFPTDWYLKETLPDDARILQSVLVPKVLSESYLHPSEVAASLASCLGKATNAFMACGAVEPALWDLYGRIVGEPLWKLIGGQNSAAAVGATPSAKFPEPGSEKEAAVMATATVGIMSPAQTLEAIRACVDAGYRRVKMEVSSEDALGRVSAVRREFPRLPLAIDANRSFKESDLPILKQLDNYGLLWIEEPLAPVGSLGENLALLSRLQKNLRTPICLDETLTCAKDAYAALKYPDLKCVAVNVGKFGGVQQALNYISVAAACGVTVWMTGLFGTGISRRLNAAFETLSQVDNVGDVGSVTRYLTEDVTLPPHAAVRGWMVLNHAPYSSGIGCELDPKSLRNHILGSSVVE